MNYIKDDFDNYTCNNISSLEELPEIINGYLFCRNNNLKDLLISKKLKIQWNFDCSNNDLTSIENNNNLILNKGFNCSNNKITSLKGIQPIINDDFNCGNNELSSLKYSPQIVKGNFFCNNNKLINLEGAPNFIDYDFNCKNNKDLKNVKDQIIKYQIKARKYITDEGYFTFEDIKKDFIIQSNILLNNKLLKKENDIKNDIFKNIKNKKLLFLRETKNKDFGLSI